MGIMLMTEYWLQKKGLGGWSMVTWYSDLDQAMTNYRKCLDNGMSGYSWRLCKVEAVEVSMLDEVTEIEAPSLEPSIPVVRKPWTDSIQPLPVKKPWGATPTPAWGGSFKIINPEPNEGLSARPGRPDLVGKVWMVNHLTKSKVRVSPEEVKLMTEAGYERGGPKTKFRE